MKNKIFDREFKLILIFLTFLLVLTLINGVNAYSSNSLLSYNDYYTDASNEVVLSQTNLLGQTFTASSDYQMKGVILNINPENQDVTVSLRLTSGDVPTGSNLVSINRTFGDSIDYSEVIFPMNYNLTNGVQYAIITSSTDNLQIIQDTSDSTFSDGTRIYSVKSPESWHFDADSDLYFKVLTNKSIENLTFTGSSNITRYLSIPQSTILTNAFLNLSGYGNRTEIDEEISYSGSAPYSWEGSVDENWSTAGLGTSGTISPPVTLVQTYGISTNNTFNICFKYGLDINLTRTGCGDTDDRVALNWSAYNYSSSSWYLIFNLMLEPNQTITTTNCTSLNPTDFISSNGIVQTEHKWYGLDNIAPHCGEYYDYEEKVNSSYYLNYPFNPSLDIGLINGNEWNYTRSFNNVNNKTSNLASIINSYMTSTYLVGTNYLIPFIFHSGTAGIIQYLDLIFNNNGFLENSQSYNSTTYEFSTENFILNIAYDSDYYSVSTANLNYNGTSYLGTQSGSNGNYIFSKSLNIPMASSDGVKYPFYWTVSLTNSSGTYNYNTSTVNQTVYQIGLDNCTTYSIKALNFTAWDEKTFNRINPFNFKISLNYFTGDGTTYRSYNVSMLNINETNICIRNHTTYKITGTIQYYADNYVVTDYNFVNFNINNITQHFNLYLLNTSSSTSFIIKVQDNNQNPLENYYVYIYRYDAGNPYLVQIVKTDSSGKGIGFFETETVDYSFVIKDSDGNGVYTSSKKKIIPETTPYTLIFTVGTITPSPYIYFNNITGLSYTLAYNKATYQVSYIYSDSNSSFVSSNLVVSALNISGSNNVICNSTLTDPSGVIICDLTGNLSGSYSATAYINRGTNQFVDNLIFEIEGMSSVAGMIGLIGAFFLLIISIFVFAYNEVAGILSIDATLIFIQVMGLVAFGWIFIFSIIAISIILLIFLERG